MKRFSQFLVEVVTSETKALKSLVNKAVKDQGIKTIGSGRGDYHIRFAMKGDGKAFAAFFLGLGLKVKDADIVVSDKYPTYTLTASKNLDDGNIPKGTSLYWVNSEISQTSSGGQIFANKDLTPDTLGLAGQQVDTRTLISLTSSALKAKYPEGNTAKELIKLLKLANTKSTSISLDELDFSKKDLAKVSADFGETLSAIWVMKSKNFAKVDFPSAVNNKLIDFYGLRLGAKYPFSVKSGTTGGKVTVMNIIRAIRSRAKTRDYKTDGEIAYQVFKIVEEKSMKDQMIELHRWLLTDNIKKLAKLMGITVDQITVETIDTWTKEQNTVKKDVWIGNKKNKKEKGKFFSQQKEFTQGKNESNSKFKARVKKEEREL